jgi:tRNA modification GTPase
VQLDLDGYPVTVIDTAGIRDANDPVEQEGVRRARARAAEADLVLWLSDPEHETQPAEHGAAVWKVRNKIDLAQGIPEAKCVAANSRTTKSDANFEISASRGDGVAELVSALIAFAEDFLGSAEGALITRQRHRQLLAAVAASLRQSMEAIGQGEELAAEDLRAAAYSLGRLLGRVDVEDVLDVIFREFCVGK